MSRRKELEPLAQQRQVLVRQYDRGEIPFSEFSEKYKKVDDEYWSEVRAFMNKEREQLKKQDVIDIERKKKMEEQVIEEKKKNYKPRGPKKDSYAAFIIEGLKRKTLGTPDKIADWVAEKKPGRDVKKIRAQVVVMTNEIKKGKKPLFKWNEEDGVVEDVPQAE